MEESLFDDVGDILLGSAPPGWARAGSVPIATGSRSGSVRRRRPVSTTKRRWSARRRSKGASVLALEVGFHSEHPQEAENDAVIAHLKANERGWRPDARQGSRGRRVPRAPGQRVAPRVGGLARPRPRRPGARPRGRAATGRLHEPSDRTGSARAGSRRGLHAEGSARVDRLESRRGRTTAHPQPTSVLREHGAVSRHEHRDGGPIRRRAAPAPPHDARLARGLTAGDGGHTVQASRPPLPTWPSAACPGAPMWLVARIEAVDRRARSPGSVRPRRTRSAVDVPGEVVPRARHVRWSRPRIGGRCRSVSVGATCAERCARRSRTSVRRSRRAPARHAPVHRGSSRQRWPRRGDNARFVARPSE